MDTTNLEKRLTELYRKSPTNTTEERMLLSKQFVDICDKEMREQGFVGVTYCHVGKDFYGTSTWTPGDNKNYYCYCCNGAKIPPNSYIPPEKP